MTTTKKKSATAAEKPAAKTAKKPAAKATTTATAKKPKAAAKSTAVEPTFTLRGQDATAPETVRVWAENFRRDNTSNGGDFLTPKAKAKYESALKIADEMAKWPGRRNPD